MKTGKLPSIGQETRPEIILIKMLLSVLAVVALRNIFFIGAGLLSILLFCLIKSPDFKYIMKRTLLVLPLVILLVIPILLGEGLSPSPERAYMASQLALKITSSALIIGFTGSKYTPEILIEGLINLRLPASLSMIIALSFRYAVMVREDVVKGKRAMAARGFKAVWYKPTLAIFGEWIGGFFIKSMEHSDKVYYAMKARGFSGNNIKREKLSITWDNLKEVSIFVIVIVTILIIERRLF
jgi:cobalt/nickel transport system permease protein